ncbi:uncharacterized protein LOC109852525 [Pseudomyrmex gracilis]|uniref:uncharacterized protein LOC109852525 n=1 Tax=Pseudomyrmex gracilis TaxID=219809 RepID=UPI000995793D|nr:uncharacterized protein LOC109852525 [Pseudomyrmex gracilis]XP_020279333.1 uncharacterized protein LOC109852525 [Pseudomyrmex gracilis]
MYKTVRKGDTSLQYTILPQTDQLASGGCPQNSGKTRPRNIKYTMGTIMILIVVSILGAPVMVNQVKYDHMVHKMMTMRQVELIVNDTYARSQTKDAAVGSKNRSRIATTTTMSTAEVTRTKDLEDGTISTLSGILREEEEEDEAVVVDDATLTDTTEITTPQTTANMETSTSARQTSTSPSAILPTILTASSTTSRVSTSGTTEDTSTFLSKVTKTPRKKPKMPRVTLKLRENETIPHMYMKAGIASYKKGNITTSVLASDLSLEGLIFKTPEGTIRPWSQKWFFTDPAANFQWKNQTQTPLLILYIFVAGMSVLLIVSFLLTFYVQRKLSRRQRSNIEEPEVEEHEDDKSTLSTLLGSENQETELKE